MPPKLLAFFKSVLNRYPAIGSVLFQVVGYAYIKLIARRKKIRVRSTSAYIDFCRGSQIIRVSKTHLVYCIDMVNSFDYYFSAVQPIEVAGDQLVDYSTPRYHDVIGFERQPVYFSSFAEPVVTTQQYLDFAQLASGSVVLDLGAYSGLTSLIFKECVGAEGSVIAVEADAENLIAIHKNLSLCEKSVGHKIELVEGAVWKDNDGLEFSTEGNMGSSAVSIVGGARGSVRKVPSFTLGTIAAKFDLARVDFIKCDIEGAEAVIFEDKQFFNRYKPRIILEVHIVDGVSTAEKCRQDLSVYGYRCKEIYQTGVTLPLLECYPPD